MRPQVSVEPFNNIVRRCPPRSSALGESSSNKISDAIMIAASLFIFFAVSAASAPCRHLKVYARPPAPLYHSVININNGKIRIQFLGI